MKKKLLSVSLFLTLSNLGFGQITLEQSYVTTSISSDISPTFNNSNNSLFYYTYNKTTNQFSIYNENHVLTKQFTAPLPSGYNIGKINLITDHLFNSDNSFEFVCSIWGSGQQNKVIIFNDEGNIVHTFNDRYIVKLEKNAANNYKLIVSDSYQETPEIPYFHQKFDVYTLTGTLSTGQEDFNINLKNLPYPNPATDILIIPTGKNTSEYSNVDVYDQAGRKIISEKIKSQNNEVILNISSLSKGTYFYKTEGSSKKFIKN